MKNKRHLLTKPIQVGFSGFNLSDTPILKEFEMENLIHAPTASFLRSNYTKNAPMKNAPYDMILESHLLATHNLAVVVAKKIILNEK